MKRILESALLIGVLLMGAFIVHSWRLRRAAAARARTSPADGPGVDVENPYDQPREPAQHSSAGLPNLRQAQAAGRSRPAVVPPPAANP